MSPAIKYTLGRLGLFVVFFVLLLPVPLHILVKAMIALVMSAVAAFLLLRKWRDEMAEQLGNAAQRRRDEKERLRAALAGDDAAAATGDRAATEARADNRAVTAEDRPATEARVDNRAVTAEDRAATGESAEGDRADR